MKSGLNVNVDSLSPFEAFKLYFSQEIEDLFVLTAKYNAEYYDIKANINTSLLYRYILFLLVSGINQLPREEIYFKPPTKLSQIIPSKISFFTHNELKTTKQLFIVDL